MARLGREKKRGQQQAAHAAHLAAVPIDVRIPVAAEGGAGPRSASVDGVLVVAGPDEPVQHAVLNRLHRIALASGHAVLATVHDERIGYVVPLQVGPDGASRFTGEPAPMKPEPGPESAPGAAPEPGPGRAPGRGVVQEEPAAAPHADASFSAAPAPGPVAVLPPRPGHDRSTHILRPVPDPAPARASAPDRDPVPDAVRDSAPTFRLRPVPGAATGAAPPGTVAAPTGEFGPPPPMDARPHPAPEADSPPGGPAASPRPPAYPLPPVDRIPSPLPPPAGPAPRTGRPRMPEPLPEDVCGSGTGTGTGTGTGSDPDRRPMPPRGFDAVAEAMLGDEPPAVPGETRLAGPMGLIDDAVRAGRIETAARLAGETVAEASQTLGPEHPEVLRLRELTAYIAYLGDEPLHAFRLSLDLAGIHRRAGDAEAAYGNVRSAATAWRAVRDPLRGLELGRDLIERWTELAGEGGPAADELEELESARARMARLTARAQHG
ncbi:tetratricopeptide repeat protein [Streptomyces sp. KMM 9044]|uniref:tetratricopeptide repeat protein n=1 Tax=Streptomyces sp. KMM 9044 TaxID=2744474 RepID=UPI0021515F6C|nr:tetratricopeptide repeat protein [Streptomyces sp. KMM 9044]WAX78529.1 tetratricopeptide repeat protein [Streptomyces sp. KMM 9044]